MKNIQTISLALLTSSLVMAGDLTILFTSKSKGMLGSTTGTETHYFSANSQMVKNDATKIDSLVDYAKGISYTIDHKKKTVQMLKWDDAAAAMDGLSQSVPKEGAKNIMDSMLGNPNDVSVDDSGAEVVAGHTCIIHKIRVGKLNMDLSADPKLKPPVSKAVWAKAIRSRAATMAKAGPLGASYVRMFEELGKIHGIPLKTKMSGVIGMDTTLEATKISEGPIPASTFALPSGYKLEDIGMKMKEELSKHPH
jgi:hypothetical protein